MYWLIIIILFLHGVGHVIGIFPTVGLFTEELSADSWLLTNLIGQTTARWLGFVLWLAATLSFIGTVLSILSWGIPQDWWRPLAMTASIVSLATIILYWDSFFATSSKVGAMAVDIIVLVVLLWLQRPFREFLPDF